MLALLVLLFTPDPGCVVWLNTEEQSRYGVHVKAEATLEAPVDAVLGALEDFDHYAEYMPRIRRAQRRGALVYTEIAAPWPMRDVWFVAEVKREKVQAGYVMSWTMRKGNIKQNNGAWWLTELPGGRTRIRYDGHVALFKMIPPVLLRMVEEHELPKVVQALRQRAARGGPLQCASTVTQPF
jgi:hypothetical protein